MAEVVHALAPFADVVVASEDIGQDRGFDHTSAWSVLEFEPDNVTAPALGTGLVQSYQAVYGPDLFGAKTLSAVDTNGIGALVDALGDFSAVSLSTPFRTTANFDRLRLAREAVPAFSDDPQFEPFRDLGQFMRNIINDFDAPAEQPLRDAAEAVLDRLAELVVAQTDDPGGTTGLSIYLPEHGVNPDPTYLPGFRDFFAGSGWFGSGFLQEFVEGPSAGVTDLEPDWAERNDSPGLARALFNVTGTAAFNRLSLDRGGTLTGRDHDWYRFRLTAPGTSVHEVSVTDRSSSGQALLLQLFDSSGVNALSGYSTSAAGRATVSLDGLTAGDYTLLVRSDAAGDTAKPLPVYSLTFVAPDPTSGTDWASGNDTRTKAFDLGQISRREVLTGLIVEPTPTGAPSDYGDWFGFSTPTSDTANPMLRINFVTSVTLSAEIYDAPTDTLIERVDSEPGSGMIEVEYASGAGQSYELRILGPVTSNIGYQIEFRPTAARAANVGVARPNSTGGLVFSLDVNGNLLFDPGVDAVFNFGLVGDHIVVGDWNASGTSKLGVARPNATGGLVFSLDSNGNLNFDPGIDAVFNFGLASDIIVVGDWNANGTSKLGVARPNATGGLVFSLDSNGNLNFDPGIDAVFNFGLAGDRIVVGDWDAVGVSKLGVARPNATGGLVFSLDSNGNLAFDPGVDAVFNFGLASDIIVVGAWPLPTALLAQAAPQASAAAVTRLTHETLQPIVETAIEHWVAAVGLDAQSLAYLQAVTIQIVDLPNRYLAVVTTDTIYLDADAGGWGWFVDPTPQLHEEFLSADGAMPNAADLDTLVTDAELIALSDGPAAGRIDLLSVVLHELGHRLGLEHDADPDALMSERLRTGVRRLPSATAIDALLGSSELDDLLP
jgi:hypothetical protein